MMTNCIRRTLCIAAAACVCLLLAAAPAAAGKVRLVAGTSLISDIAADLLGQEAEMLTLVQGSACPGHDNARTADFVFAAKADAVLLHGFQKNLPQVSSMLESTGGSTKVRFLGVRGSWLIPENQEKATLEMAEALAAALPSMKDSIRERAQKRVERIRAAGARCLEMLASRKGARVAAATMQAEFVKWAGFDVVATYGRAEDMTAADLARLMDSLKGRNIRGVVDNMQSGADAGMPIASELGVPHIVLSNFPGYVPEVPDWFSLIEANAKALEQI